MFDIFGIRKRREEKRRAEEAARQAELQEKKRQYQARKKLITDYLDVYLKEERKKTDERYDRDKKYAEQANSKCPKCGSKNVVNHIRRTKGEIHGNGSISGFSSHSSGLFSSHSLSSLNGRSKIDGELDTLPVNKCNDCGNEWKVEEVKYGTVYNKFSTHNSTCPNQLFFRLEEYLDMEYDSNDITEECNSLEEKREKYVNEISSNKYIFTEYRTAPRYMIEYALYNSITQFYFREETAVEKFGFDKDTDCYSYQMSDELWEITKKLLNWKGDEEKS